MVEHERVDILWGSAYISYVKARIVHALTATNPGKLRRLDALQAVYRDYVQACIDQMVTAKLGHVTPKEYRTFFSAHPILTSQLAKCARPPLRQDLTTAHGGTDLNTIQDGQRLTTVDHV